MGNVQMEHLKGKPLFSLTVEEFIELQKNTQQPNLAQESLPNIIGIEEAVKLTGYKRSTIYSKTSNKTIPYHKRSGRIVFLRSELEAWMLENRQETVEEGLQKLDEQFLRQSNRPRNKKKA